MHKECTRSTPAIQLFIQYFGVTFGLYAISGGILPDLPDKRMISPFAKKLHFSQPFTLILSDYSFKFDLMLSTALRTASA
ncbi:MAG: hypothetical protein AMXMBFR84_18740 [Candidatus Hydrogenedentota bacterium]